MGRMADQDPGSDHGHDDHDMSEGHEAALGPIDIQAWGALLLGIVLGLVMVVAFVQALG
jgi:hypothetical protein